VRAACFFGKQSRFRKSEQDDNWNVCLTTAIAAVNRRNHEQTTPPEPLTGLQGKGGSGRRQRRPDNRPLAEHFDVHPNQITAWKSRLEGSASEVFGSGGGTPAIPAIDVKSLHANIGELTLENDFLEGALTKAGLLSAKRSSTASTTCRSPSRQRF